jgi:hypothetical protein
MREFCEVNVVSGTKEMFQELQAFVTEKFGSLLSKAEKMGEMKRGNGYTCLPIKSTLQRIDLERIFLEEFAP